MVRGIGGFALEVGTALHQFHEAGLDTVHHSLSALAYGRFDGSDLWEAFFVQPAVQPPLGRSDGVSRPASVPAGTHTKGVSRANECSPLL